MMIQPIGLIVFLIKVLILIKSNSLVRSVCLQDALAFYYKKDNAACQFSAEHFTNVFIDNTARCQLVDCTIDYLFPSHGDMSDSRHYEIEELRIRFFSNLYAFIMKKPCPFYENVDVYVTINCEGNYQRDRRIGESCVDDNQCVSGTVNSTCNGTTGLCQCKPGHLHLWENNTCSPVQELGGLCYDSRQCKLTNPHSMCNNENRCECQHGNIKLNNSCLQERRLNETCDDDVQCSVVTPNSTCNKTTKVCECTEGRLEMLNMCVHEQDLGGRCFDTRQCKRVNPYSMCSVENKCECINGYTELNNTCLPESGLYETCDDDVQCSVVTPNSTCNKTTKVCECTEGRLEMLNMCVYGRVLMEEISHLCKRASLSIENMANKYTAEQICSMYSEASPSIFKEEENNSSAGLVIGVGIAGFMIGIAFCGAVYFIVTRHRAKFQNRTNAVKEEIKQPRSVEVSNAVNSKPILHKNERCNSSIVVENAIYNHLHEGPSEICIQPDYDHVPQLGYVDDDYSHLATCNSTDVDSPGEYGVVN